MYLSFILFPHPILVTSNDISHMENVIVTTNYTTWRLQINIIMNMVGCQKINKLITKNIFL